MLNRAAGPFARALAAVRPDNDHAASSEAASPPRAPTAHARALVALAGLAALALALPGAASAFDQPFIGSFTKFSEVGSTVPANGDENPYGIVNVTTSTGSLVAGDILISNFNNSANLQGTGTTIVQLSPGGRQTLFAQINPAALSEPCPGGVGLTTALAILPHGFVVVGSLPTKDGSASTAEAGCLIVLDSSGHVVETISGPPINGPWDMTSVAAGENATLFVTNVLNGTVASGEAPIDEGTVVRIRVHTSDHRPPKVTSESVIATGFPERTDPSALVVGPTGVAVGDEGTLYVADTQGNRIAAVPGALSRSVAIGEGGTTIAKGGYLNSPLGLTLAPNGDVLTANAADGDLVETTPVGAEFQPFDTGAGEGGLFGLVVAPSLKGAYLVDDANNTVGLAH
jgi:hypothetical protein